ncbi:hypothetical protein [Ensifer canadensis]
MHTQLDNRLEKESPVMIDHLKSEISRLNDELTCASEAHQSIVSENQRMKEALEIAERVFRAAGNSEMAERMIYAITGYRPAPVGFKKPTSRKVA